MVAKARVKYNLQSKKFEVTEPDVAPAPKAAAAPVVPAVKKQPKKQPSPAATQVVPTTQPVATPVTTPSVPAQDTTQVAERPVRQQPQVNIPEATNQGWSNLYSPNPADVGGATSAVGDTAQANDPTMLLLQTLLGRGTGVSPEQARAGGLQAAKILEAAGQKGQELYGQQATELANKLNAIYNPLYTQRESDIGTSSQTALDFLESQYGINKQNIDDATAAALNAIPASMAYKNVPIVNLAQEKNPLLNALGAYGAGTTGVSEQSAADAQIAQQLSDLVKGSAGQLSAAQQAVLDAAKYDVQTGGSTALQQLALARQAQQAGISAEKQRALNELGFQRAGTSADVINAQQALLNQGIQSLLAGMTEGATQRAKTVEQYGPDTKTAKTLVKATKPKATTVSKITKTTVSEAQAARNQAKANPPKSSKPAKTTKAKTKTKTKAKAGKK